LPLIEEQVDPTVWTDGHTVGWARTLVPVLFISRTPPGFPIKINIL
jgi:hypothetical protein